MNIHRAVEILNKPLRHRGQEDWKVYEGGKTLSVFSGAYHDTPRYVLSVTEAKDIASMHCLRVWYKENEHRDQEAAGGELRQLVRELLED